MLTPTWMSQCLRPPIRVTHRRGATGYVVDFTFLRRLPSEFGMPDYLLFQLADQHASGT